MNFLLKLLRGGSWYHNPKHCRSAVRYLYGADYANRAVGFRVICYLP
jgi:formylglycine-generating enzyme required for sulfatase activity